MDRGRDRHGENRGRDRGGGGGGDGICRQFRDTGSCKFGDRCKFSHDIRGGGGSQNRGRGQRGGPPGGGGGRPQAGGRPQQSRVAPGGQVPLRINYFKLSIKSSSQIYIYQIDFGGCPEKERGQVIRSIRGVLKDQYFKDMFNVSEGNLYSTVKYDE